MRPSTLLMVLGIGAFAVSMLAIASEPLPDETGLYLFGLLGVLLVLDIAVSRAGSGWQVALDGPKEIFTQEDGAFTLTVSTPGRLPGEIRARLEWPRGLSGPDEVRLSPTEDGAATGMAVRAVRRAGPVPPQCRGRGERERPVP